MILRLTEVNLPNDTQIRGIQNDLENKHFNQLHKDTIHFSKYTYKIEGFFYIIIDIMEFIERFESTDNQYTRKIKMSFFKDTYKCQR